MNDAHDSRPVLVVGAGLAGLACALHLHRAGRRVEVFERAEAVGGRVRTDRQDGYLLDRGFQVVLTAYPEMKDLFEPGELGLRHFEPGALIRIDGRFERLVDPTRRPSALWDAARARVGTWADKLRSLRMGRRIRKQSGEQIFAQEDRSSLDALRSRGFSERMVESFYRPFLGGIFLDPSLQTSVRMMDFVLRMFGEGSAALPAGGMQSIPEQLAARLPVGCLHTEAEVTDVQPDSLSLANGERREGLVVLATDPSQAAALSGGEDPGWRSTCSLAFAAERSPLAEPILVLDGEGKGPIHSLCVPSDVQPSYAEQGALVQVSVLGTPNSDLEPSIRAQLQEWFGEEVRDWRLLRTTSVPRALPVLDELRWEPEVRSADGRLFRCGDGCSMPSVQGALASGRATARAVMAAALRADAPASDRPPRS